MINLNFLTSFIDLCETLSFSKTARRLNTAQPAVSRHIKELEAALGYTLFLRTKKSVRLTDAGVHFKNHVGSLYSQLLDRIDSVNKEQQYKKLVIKVGCTVEAGENLLYPFLKRLAEKHPDVQMQLSLTSTNEIFKKLTEGELDLGVVTRDPLLKGVASLDFHVERPVLIGPVNPSFNIQNLTEIKIATYRENDRFTTEFFERNFSKALRKKIVIIFTANSHRLMIDFIKSNNAFAVIPLSSAREIIANKSLKIHLEDKRGFTLKLVYKASLTQDARKMKFIEYLIDSLTK